MDIQFEGKRVLVTGAARGIGRAICEAFAADGAAVLATDVVETELQRLAAEASPARGGSISTGFLDVTDEEQIARVIAGADIAGGIDIFVHVAGGVLGQTKSRSKTFRRPIGTKSMTLTCAGHFWCRALSCRP